MATNAYEEMSQYWTRNRKLNRPLSPFLTVYKPHLAMMTSLTHRITGVAMQVAICGTSIILLCLPIDFKKCIEFVRGLNLPPAVIYGAKYVLAFPVTYHFLNGLRHLAWDAGYGFGLKTLYKSGYFAIALTAVVSTYFVFGIKPSAL